MLDHPLVQPVAATRHLNVFVLDTGDLPRGMEDAGPLESRRPGPHRPWALIEPFEEEIFGADEEHDAGLADLREVEPSTGDFGQAPDPGRPALASARHGHGAGSADDDGT